MLVFFSLSSVGKHMHICFYYRTTSIRSIIPCFKECFMIGFQIGIDQDLHDSLHRAFGLNSSYVLQSG